MESKAIKVILFDLGGVLIYWDGVSELVKLTNGALNREQARTYFLNSTWMNLFESGNCTPETFAEGVVSDLDLSVQPQEFIDIFLSWDRGFEAGALELLNILKPHFLLGCLSNNNILHWSRLCTRYRLNDIFHKLYPSHETGFVKPSKKAFENVVDDTGALPDQFLFFDDNQECIESARQIGMDACQVAGVEEVTQALKNRGLLS